LESYIIDAALKDLESGMRKKKKKKQETFLLRAIRRLDS